MPILQFGQFTLRLTGYESAIGKSSAVAFEYYPYFDLFCLFVFLVFLYLLWNPDIFDASYHRVKCWVFFPMLIGLLLKMLSFQIMQLFSFPLFALTLILLTWRWRKHKHWLTSSLSAYLICGALITCSVISINNTLPPFSGLLIVFLLGGLALSFPVLVLQIMIRREVTINQLMKGLTIGFIVPFLILSILILIMKLQYQYYLMVFSILGLNPLILAALILWNPWVCDVTTGTMFEKQKIPESSPRVPS